jgi:hypothetical protein
MKSAKDSPPLALRCLRPTCRLGGTNTLTGARIVLWAHTTVDAPMAGSIALFSIECRPSPAAEA